MKLNVTLRVLFIESGEFLLKCGDSIQLRTSNIQEVTSQLFKMGIEVSDINSLITEALNQVRDRMGVLIFKKNEGPLNETRKSHS